MTQQHFDRRFLEKLEKLVNLERQEEMALHYEEMRNLSGAERERRGRALIRLRATPAGRAIGGRSLARFARKGDDPLPDSEIKVGDIVLWSKGHPDPDRDPQGTAYQKTRAFLTVLFDDRPAKAYFVADARLDLFSNETTYTRMLDAIQVLQWGKEAVHPLKNALFGQSKPKFSDTPASVSALSFFNRRLNESQKSAVLQALRARSFFLIHGPPGTGKTTTCIELVAQLVQRGERALVTGDSNTSVDNLVEGLAAVPGLALVRLGNPARVSELLFHHTLDYQVETDARFAMVRQLRDQIAALREAQSDLARPTLERRRGLSKQELRRLASRRQASRGLPAEAISEMRDWMEIQDQIDPLVARARMAEDEIIRAILVRADVVCATNSTAGVEMLDGLGFDSVVIDEATQATEPSCYIPLLRGGRFFLAGDHRQLPPTVRSREAADLGLGTSLFERLLELYPDHGSATVHALLTVQYRMNEKIMAFPSAEFYNHQLIADESARDRTIEEFLIKHPYREHEALFRQVVSPEPLLFIDTAGHLAEVQRTGSFSRENPAEAALVIQIVRHLYDYGMPPLDMGVITPYKDQVDTLRKNLGIAGVEVHTVDGFQGREKEVIVLSLVRSNPVQEIGFLADERRLNVSLTRARRKLIVIGDRQTLAVSPVYARLMESIAERGTIIEMNESHLQHIAPETPAPAPTNTDDT